MTLFGITFTLSDVVDVIILLGALCAAIYKIWDFFAKPTTFLKSKKEQREKERIKEVLDKELPIILKKHDLETKEKYKADRERYLQEIKEEVLGEVSDPIAKNTDDLEALKISAKDVLREKIMAVYHKNKRERVLLEHEKEALVQYYKDYKKLNGNSYIDKYHARMEKWQVIYDDYEDEQ